MKDKHKDKVTPEEYQAMQEDISAGRLQRAEDMEMIAYIGTCIEHFECIDDFTFIGMVTFKGLHYVVHYYRDVQNIIEDNWSIKWEPLHINDTDEDEDDDD